MNGHARKPFVARPLRAVLLAALAIASALMTVAPRGGEGDGPPPIPPGDRNVLLVTIDTLRADTPSFAGGSASTPNLDALARSGIVYDFAHSHAVVTLPSHASILSGLYPFAHGIRDNSGYRLRAGTATIATFLEGRGYATAAFVGAFPLDSRFGLNAGFHVYDDRYPGSGRASELLMPERRADAVVAAASSWIRGQKGRWFAWVHVFDPHAPYSAPSPFRERYSGDPYAGEVAWTDHALGPLLEAARSGETPSLVVVTSDHGEALGAHGEATHGLFAYEETLKVPLIIAATDLEPRRRPARTMLSARHVDLFPTIASSLRLPVPGGLPGRALPGFRPGGETVPVPSYFEALSASLNRGWAPLTGVLLGREKYIDLPLPELYDLEQDAAEKQNRHDERPARVRVLSSVLGAFPRNALPTDGRTAEDADTRRRLESLGYVSSSASPPRNAFREEDDPKRLVGLDQVVQRGVDLFQQGHLQAALAAYKDAIRQRPSMSTPYLHIAFAAWETGNPREAIETLRSGLAAGADNAEMRAQLGIYLAEAGSPDEAIAILQSALARDPNDLDGLNGLGIALSRAGRAADAEQAFRSILERHPANVQALQNLGMLALARDDLAEARRAFDSALTLDSTLVGALNGLGVVESRSGRNDEAVELWRRVVAIDPHQFDALYNLGSTLMKQGAVAQARPYLEQFASTAPPSFYAEDLNQVRRWLGGR